MTAPSRSNIERLIDIMARLRDPDTGCPWDIEQTFETIAPYTIEEAYEVAEAIRNEDMHELEEELGDLLLQVVYHARMAEESGAFDFDKVARAIGDKMVRRHPHVFGSESIASAADQTRSWEATKADERAAKAAHGGRAPSVLDGVAVGLPGATRAIKLQNRAARVGFDWPATLQVFDKIDEEIAEIKQEIENEAGSDRLADEVGDLLFVVVNLARHLEVDPEAALRQANGKFESRFRAVEETFRPDARALSEVPLDEMEAAWQAAKKRGL